MLPISVDQVWVRLDECNRLTGDSFVGTLSDLQSDLAKGLRDVPPDFSGSGRETVYVDHLGESVECYALVMRTPWGTYRWIQEPPADRPTLRRRVADMLSYAP